MGKKRKFVMAAAICTILTGACIYLYASGHGKSSEPKQKTVQIGIAVYNPQYETSSQFFEMADEALYHAKASGKNRVCIK